MVKAKATKSSSVNNRLKDLGPIEGDDSVRIIDVSRSSPPSLVLDSSKKIRIRIVGLKPGLLFQSKGIMFADLKATTKSVKHRPPEEEAYLRCHWISKSMLDEGDLADGRQHHEVNGDIACIPWVVIYMALCEAGKAFKSKGRKSFSEIMAATVSCKKPECQKIPIQAGPYEVFEEFCRIPPRTGAMVMIGRPHFKEWAAEFTVMVDDEGYEANIVYDILKHAGKVIGLGAWRPMLKGPYGRFVVDKFEYVV
jgi:hypothetical protein